MREILFRGKRKDNNEWVYGDLLQEPTHCFYSIMPQTPVAGNYQVTPETVGQYTGLKDKNGKKIFEGDLISTDLDRNYIIVEFKNGCFMLNCEDGGRQYYDIFYSTFEDAQRETCEYGEVIGNIYDNQELLEGYK